jgi:hypothetical protein
LFGRSEIKGFTFIGRPLTTEAASRRLRPYRCGAKATERPARGHNAFEAVRHNIATGN